MWYGSYAMMVGLCLLGRPSAQYSIHLSSYQDIYLKAYGIALVSISRRKGGRRTSLRRTFGLVPFPLFFFTFSSSEGLECGRATIYF